MIDGRWKLGILVGLKTQRDCCGFAGDKGFTTPELNTHPLRTLMDAVQQCSEGISTSRTCEIGLTQHGGIDYHGLVYLVDRVTQARPA